jgi:hypothetical protein
LSNLSFLCASDSISNGHQEFGVFVEHLHFINFYQVTKPLLKGTLYQELGGNSQLITIGLKNQFHKTTTEIRSVYSFPGTGKQHLPDKIADMAIIIRIGCAAITVEVKRETDVHSLYNYYMPITLIWVITINKGVPLGTQIAWLSINNTGIPLDNMRVAAVTH